MSIKGSKLNITVDADMVGLLNKMAKQEHKSTSSLAKKLILEALEHREDMALSTLAATRDIKGKKTIKHQDAFK